MRNKACLVPWLLSVVLISTYGFAGMQQPMPRVCFTHKCFYVEIADTPRMRERGLMWRAALEEGEGMFFEFTRPDIYEFWMKNVAFPIDIIWMDAEKRIVHIESSVPPCKQDPCPTYNPGVAAQYVLEISSGAADRYKLQVGDQAELK